MSVQVMYVTTNFLQQIEVFLEVTYQFLILCPLLLFTVIFACWQFETYPQCTVVT